jgi:hypothetical protein
MNVREIEAAIKPGLFGVAIGAAALAIIGFYWGGWMTGSKAMAMAEQAKIEELVPICVGQFTADADKAAKLAALKKIDSWKQSDYVIQQGWATMPGATKANSDIARDCANKITS